MGPRISVAPSAGVVAAEFTGTLWAAICAAGGTGRAAADGPMHHRGAFDTGWVAGLALPIDAAAPAGASVALLDDGEDFERPGRAGLAVAYAARPRTRVYEDIGRDDPGAWYALVARHLGRLAGCELAVVCSIFQSRAGDESLGAHHDAWDGAIVQTGGAKDWEIGQSLLDGTGRPARRVTTRAGDILLMPKGLPHAVNTPPDPGHSAHLAFAINRDSDAPALIGASPGHA